MSKKGDYILWLPSWYPSRLDPFSGDFIQRHARAAALHVPVKVLFVVRDELGVVTRDVHEVVFRDGDLEERVIYYYQPPKKWKTLEKYLSFRRYQRLNRQAVEHLVAAEGMPALTHVHIAMKAGLVARWIKRAYSVPYVITEQWTVYLEEARPNFSDFSLPFQYLFRRVFTGAASVSAVSAWLGERLQRLFGVNNLKVLPNVVDTGIFYPVAKEEGGPVRFLHISLLGYQKNPEGMLEAFFLLKKQRSDFHLDIVGPRVPRLSDMAARLGLASFITFHPEVPQPYLVKLVQQADALVLYSRYETFGCVLIEAHACGLPVIVSDVPVMHENVREGFNGLFARNEDPAALAGKLLQFLRDRKAFDKSAIAAYARQHYNFHAVGARFKAWYDEVLEADKREIPPK